MRVCITGVGGTIGRAFTEYLSEFHEVSGIDHNETNVARLKEDFPTLNIWVGDFESVNLQDMDLVIHLAAMKHIDLCEANPSSCVVNNVIRTYELYLEARLMDVDVLFMSTDKAVEPTSVYGYSKAIMEAVTLEHGWAVVRSGNVVNSNGSVFSVWDEAIAQNKPVKLTHKDMRRFFISPENLVRRVWAKYMNGEKLIIPEMDIDAKLVDILETKLKEHGKDIKTYPIEYIGLRKGEKLVERLL